jgi:hypothetical protein
VPGEQGARDGAGKSGCSAGRRSPNRSSKAAAAEVPPRIKTATAGDGKKAGRSQISNLKWEGNGKGCRASRYETSGVRSKPSGQAQTTRKAAALRLDLKPKPATAGKLWPPTGLTAKASSNLKFEISNGRQDKSAGRMPAVQKKSAPWRCGPWFEKRKMKQGAEARNRRSWLQRLKPGLFSDYAGTEVPTC